MNFPLLYEMLYEMAMENDMRLKDPDKIDWPEEAAELEAIASRRTTSGAHSPFSTTPGSTSTSNPNRSTT